MKHNNFLTDARILLIFDTAPQLKMFLWNMCNTLGKLILSDDPDT